MPDDLGTRWSNWVNLLPSLLDIHISMGGGQGKRKLSRIHVFCDAFTRTYGAVLYIRSTHRTGTLVRIVCSKNRLAPLKRVTLPRLEHACCITFARKRVTTSRKQHCGQIQPWLWDGYAMTPTGGRRSSQTVSLKYRPTLRLRSGSTVQVRTIQLITCHVGLQPSN